MSVFFRSIIYSFLISFGVMIGACLFAGIGAIITKSPPLKTMIDLARSIKIWAVAVGLGGTFYALEVIQDGILKGDIRALIKQVVYILAALIGANLGYLVIKLMSRCGDIWRM